MTAAQASRPAAAAPGTAPLAVAPKYAASDHPVLPIVPAGKVPLAALVPRGLKDATTDPAVIAEWAAHTPDANIAIRCDGLLVLDVDPGGEEAIVELEREHGPLPATLEQSTPRGGRHVLYRLPEGVDLGNSTRALGHPQGLDIRAGSRGYLLVAPSRNGTGAYTWLNRTPIADAPDWLVDLLTRPPRPEPEPPALRVVGGHTPYGRAALEAEIAAVESAPEGQRNSQLNESAFALGQLESGGELAPGDTEALLVAAAMQAGLRQDEARRTAHSGLEAGRGSPRSAPENPARGTRTPEPPASPYPQRRPGEPTLEEALSDSEFFAQHIAPFGELLEDGPPAPLDGWHAPASGAELTGPKREHGGDRKSVMIKGQKALEPDEAEPFVGLELDVILASPPAEPDWDWRGYHARADVVLEAGDPGVGKSMNILARSVLSATGGGEHLGEPVAARRVLFLDLESPDDVVYQRLHALGLRGSCEGFSYVHRPQGFNLLDELQRERLRATIVEHRAEVVVIDSLRRAAPALDENDSRQVSIVFSGLRDLAAELGTTILVVHHPRKPVGDAKVEALYAARGSGDLVGSVDSYVFYRKLSGGLVRIEHAKARRGREHEPVHFRIVADDEGAPRIERVEVEAGPSDEELENAVLAFVESHPGASTKQVENGVTGSRSAVRKALERLSMRGESQSLAAGPGRHPKGKYWYPLNHAGLESPGESQAILGDISPGLSQGHVSPESPAPRRGGESRGDIHGQRLATPAGDGSEAQSRGQISESELQISDAPRAGAQT